MDFLLRSLLPHARGRLSHLAYIRPHIPRMFAESWHTQYASLFCLPSNAVLYRTETAPQRYVLFISWAPCPDPIGKIKASAFIYSGLAPQ